MQVHTFIKCTLPIFVSDYLDNNFIYKLLLSCNHLKFNITEKSKIRDLAISYLISLTLSYVT